MEEAITPREGDNTAWRVVEEGCTAVTTPRLTRLLFIIISQVDE
jgi:hypothetical protein